MPRSAGKRQNTKLEAEGAEFLVLGHLLLAGIPAFKAYVNFTGYDLVATNPATGRTARIQVKSRWATNYDRTFPIKNYDCEFVVHVALNRGFRFGKRAPKGDSGIRPPDCYVLPTALVQKAKLPGSKWGKVSLRRIPECDAYKESWHLIAEYLATAP